MKMTAAAFLALLAPVAVFAAGTASSSSTSTSKFDHPSNFKPPQVFKNANLVHIISLEKNFAKEYINVVVENVSKEPQDAYYLPFRSDRLEKTGGFEVKDRKDASVTGFVVQAVEFDPLSEIQYYRIQLPTPLGPKATQTLGISFYGLQAYSPLPAAISQGDRQYLVHAFSAYCPSAYVTSKQKTEVKFPSADIKEHTKIAGQNGEEYPEKQGAKLTYGPFTQIPAGTVSPAKVRFEFNKPVTHVALLERDIEVSHWGGNVAFEERYTLYHKGANLSALFNRAKWTQSQFYNPATHALKELRFPLRVGSKDAYYTDVIGNISTSRFRNNKRESVLEIKPRYPVFGGWKFPFTIGWNADTKRFLRKLAGDSYILNVPFLEGPKQPEGVEYENVHLRIWLPEGARNVKFLTSIPESSITEHTIEHKRTFLDTAGRTVLTIKARNLADDFRDRELIVSYKASLAAALRKPLVIFATAISVFVGAWLLSLVDVKFSTR